MSTADNAEPNQESYDAILRCNKCGFCQANCPTYKDLWEESACARGRIRLFRAVVEGEQDISESYIKALDRCTSCMACSASCPSGADPYRLILAARANAVASKGLPKLKAFGLRSILAREEVHGLAFALASSAQRLGLTRLVPKQLVPTGVDVNHFPVSAIPFRRQVSEANPANKGSERVAFFVGCMIDHSLPNVGHATLRVLKHLGVDVLVPKKLKCCGFPFIVSGDLESARVLAEHNLKILKELPVDHIITSCATCGSALKNEYRELFKNTPLAEEANAVAEKAIDISSYLDPRMDQLQLGETNLRVTYHDPCHLVRGLGVSTGPRHVIKSVPGVEYKEMAEANRCCGAAGVFQVFFSDLAWRITQRKLDNIRATEAEVVVSPCPACLQRLSGGLQQTDAPQQAIHIVELLDRSLSSGNRVAHGKEPRATSRAGERR